jgi:hypothetical protein
MMAFAHPASSFGLRRFSDARSANMRANRAFLRRYGDGDNLAAGRNVVFLSLIFGG